MSFLENLTSNFSMSKSNLSKKYFIVIIVVIVFLLFAIFTYFTYIKPKLEKNYVPNKEYINTSQTDSADLYFFYTDWCPHCKTAKPVWTSLKAKYKDKLFNNNVTINFIEVDCEKDTSTANKFNVEGYPTIKLVYNSKIIEYDAKPDFDNLEEFLRTSIV